jgi:SAM-dependent methyltransferase
MKQHSRQNSAGQEHPPLCNLPNGMLDVRACDWNQVWQAQRAKRSAHKRDDQFWDKRAPSFAKAASETDYAKKFLKILKPQPHWNVLDMGCGGGTIAVPLSKMVSSVTAVDFSAKMLDALRSRYEAEGIGNITTLQGSWEDDWGKLGVKDYDVAIASRSLVSDDMLISIIKLNTVARKRVYLVTLVGDGPYDRRIFEAIGRPLHSEPDYIYTYMMLYQMGIFANVTFIEEIRNRTYKDMAEAIESTKWMFQDMTPEEEKKLVTYVKDNLVLQAGSWKFSYKRLVRWAVMWWEKNNGKHA